MRTHRPSSTVRQVEYYGTVADDTERQARITMYARRFREGRNLTTGEPDEEMKKLARAARRRIPVVEPDGTWD